MPNTRLDVSQVGIKIAGRNINNLGYAIITTLMAESKKKLKNLLRRMKEKVKKLAWNSTFKKQRSWHPIPSLHGKYMGKQWKLWQTIFLGSKITTDGDCSHEIKRCTFLESVMPSSHLILSRHSLLPPAIFPSIRVFSNESGVHIYGQSIGSSASASVLPMNIQDWFPLRWTGWISLQSKGLSRVFSSPTIWKHQFFGAWPSLWSNSHIHRWLLEKP